MTFCTIHSLMAGNLKMSLEAKIKIKGKRKKKLQQFPHKKPTDLTALLVSNYLSVAVLELTKTSLALAPYSHVTVVKLCFLP